MSRCFLVARVSSRHQAESGLGVESQLTKMRAYALSNDLTVISIFKDEGISGATPLHRRSGLLACLNTIQKGDVVVFADRSRIGRDPLVVLSIESEIYKAGGRILTADGINSADESPEQVLIRRLIDSVNEFQRGVLRAKTSMALQELKKKGLSTGVPPFGKKVGEDGKTLVPNPKEEKILGYVLANRSAGMTWKEIAGGLNLFSTTRRGNAWTISSCYGTFSKRTTKEV